MADLPTIGLLNPKRQKNARWYTRYLSGINARQRDTAAFRRNLALMVIRARHHFFHPTLPSAFSS